MKNLLLLSSASALFLSGCVSPEPAAPVVIERHHYHTRTETRPVYVRTPTPSRAKAAPSMGGSSSAEGFRAVEQPGSYSQ